MAASGPCRGSNEAHEGHGGDAAADSGMTRSKASRLLVLGSESAFSGVVLEHLLEAGVEVCGFVVQRSTHSAGRFESSGRTIPLVVGGTGPAIAAEGGVPVFAVESARDEHALERLRETAPDVVLAACFPVILPPAWRALARRACLNLHPSLLPAYRGPTPLFWQLREGERETGVTLHLVDAGIDAGDIVAQSVVPLPVGARFSDVNATLARTGAALMVDLLRMMEAGIEAPRTAQDDTLASYQPFPREKDFRFDTHFSAERAFCFMRGAEEWGVPFEVDVGGTVLELERALAYHDDARMAVPYTIDGGEIRIRFSEGVLEAVGRVAVD